MKNREEIRWKIKELEVELYECKAELELLLPLGWGPLEEIRSLGATRNSLVARIELLTWILGN